MSQLKREDWLERGLSLLAEEGTDALTIDSLCQRFSVTKGSFYHHFKNRQAFLEALLQFWEERYTSKFIAYSSEGKTPLEQLERLQELVVQSYGSAEMIIRAWAQSDPIARHYQERVDRRRLDYLYELLLKIYRKPELARSMAQMQYAILIGSPQILPALSAEDLQQIFSLVSRLVLSEEDNPP
jgi:AcrR family transcriptional regulator